MVRFGANGAIQLEDVLVPSQSIPPGGSFEVIAVVKNTAGGIFGDPDQSGSSQTPCEGRTTTNSYCLRAFSSVGGSTRDKVFESAIGIPAPNMREVSIDMPAPEEEGEHQVTVYLEGTVSGNRSTTESATIVVSTGSQTVDTGDDSGGNGDGGNGGANATSLLQTAIGNPAGVIVVGGLGLVAFNRLSDGDD